MEKAFILFRDEMMVKFDSFREHLLSTRMVVDAVGIEVGRQKPIPQWRPVPVA